MESTGKGHGLCCRLSRIQRSSFIYHGTWVLGSGWSGRTPFLGGWGNGVLAELCIHFVKTFSSLFFFNWIYY